MKTRQRIRFAKAQYLVLGWGVASAGMLVGPDRAMAQSATTSISTPIVAAPNRTGVVSPATPPAQTSEIDCRTLNTLKYPGFESPIFPPVCDTVDADWRFRKTLYDYGFLTSLQLQDRNSYDILGHNSPAQKYSGQDVTISEAIYLEINYDLSRIGLPKGSIFSFGPEFRRTDYTGSGPNAGAIGELGAFVPLFNDRVELQIGYEQWQSVFYGSNYGTSSATSALGPSSSLQTEVGMANFDSSPGADIRLWAPDHHFYDHFGVSRSAAPGNGYGYDTARGPGVEAIVPGTGALFINEVGYRIPRGPDTYYFWLRSGAIYNNSEFTNFDRNDLKARGNQGFYLSGDFQFTKPDASAFIRGLYLNFKLDAAPPDRNRFAEDASVSLYDIGPFDFRPKDTVSLGLTYNRLSPYAADYIMQHSHVDAPRWSTSLIGSYVFHLYRGVFLIAGLSWVKHPESTDIKPGSAVNATEALNVLF